MLTKKQKEKIQALKARICDDRRITLYRANSLTGGSWTLRWKEKWADRSSGSAIPRRDSRMLFSVTIPNPDIIPLLSSAENVKAHKKYTEMCEEAERLFTY